MNALTNFRFENNDVRVVTGDDGEPWFVAVDVCSVLGIQNTADALKRLDDDEKGIDSIDTLGGSQNVATINEPGIFSLVLGSRKPEAKTFKRWVTHNVLPAIRKTGGYGQQRPNESDVRPAVIFKSAVTAGVEYKDALAIMRELLGLPVETIAAEETPDVAPTAAPSILRLRVDSSVYVSHTELARMASVTAPTIVRHLYNAKMVRYDWSEDLKRNAYLPTKKGLGFCKYDALLGRFAWKREVLQHIF